MNGVDHQGAAGDWVKFVQVFPEFVGAAALEIYGIRPGKGVIAYLLFDHEKGFPRQREHAVLGDYVKAPESSDWEIALPVQVNKKYVLTVYQDLNGNRQLDKDIFGYPQEPVGASMNPRVCFGPPSYSDCEFLINESTTLIDVHCSWIS